MKYAEPKQCYTHRPKLLFRLRVWLGESCSHLVAAPTPGELSSSEAWPEQKRYCAGQGGSRLHCVLNANKGMLVLPWCVPAKQWCKTSSRVSPRCVSMIALSWTTLDLLFFALTVDGKNVTDTRVTVVSALIEGLTQWPLHLTPTLLVGRRAKTMGKQQINLSRSCRKG